MEEKLALNRLNSPYIIKLIETSKDNDSLYFWLEPVLGGTLSEHLRTHGYFDAETVCQYATQLICAVGHMNERGCMHRDIKASNCLLSENGHIKLCDFSSAKSFDISCCSAGSGRPVTTTVIGTVEFMSPEMIARTGYSFGTDMWSLGVLLFELLTSRRPYELNIITYKSLLEQKRDGKDEASTASVDFYEANGSLDFDEDCFHFSDLGRCAAQFLKEKLLVREADRILPKDGLQEFAHEFFSGIDWSLVSAGSMPPISFDRSIGYFDMVESYTNGDSEIDCKGVFQGF